MLRLILMRHAKSDWGNFGLSDHERPLNKRGQTSATALGKWLRAQGYGPDEVLCSTAQRTRETLAGLELEPVPDTQFVKQLYHAEAAAMLSTLSSATAQCVLMLGHNPGICEMAHRLVDDPPDHDRFSDYPTGGTLVCDIDAAAWSDVRWHRARVVEFVIPRELTA